MSGYGADLLLPAAIAPDPWGDCRCRPQASLGLPGAQLHSHEALVAQVPAGGRLVGPGHAIGDHLPIDGHRSNEQLAYGAFVAVLLDADCAYLVVAQQLSQALASHVSEGLTDFARSHLGVRRLGGIDRCQTNRGLGIAVVHEGDGVTVGNVYRATSELTRPR